MNWKHSIACSLFAALFLLATAAGAAGLDPKSPSYGELPLVFESNEGQVSSGSVDFLARGPGYNIALTSSGALLSLSRDGNRRHSAGPDRLAVRMQLLEAATEASVQTEDPLPTRIHYFLGNDPRSWRSGIATFGQVRYREVYPGIDVVYYGNGRRLEYDFVVSPGADPSAIGFRFEGAEDVRVDEGGSLRVQVDGASLALEAPVIYQQGAGGRTLVAGGYEVDSSRHIRFALGDYDRSRTLTIDPILVYSTFLGGSALDRLTAVAVDSDGSAYVTGFTESLDFPTASSDPAGPAQGLFAGGNEDVVVTKLNPEGSQIVYSTYIGGTDTFRERGNNIVVDDSGQAHVVCSTNATDFPVASSNPAGPLQQAASLGDEGCVFKLSADGSSLVFSTYLGGNGNDTANGVDIDADGNVYIGGFTGSTTLPVTSPNPAGAFQITRQGTSDAYLAKLIADGSSLVYLTYLGGTGGEGAAEIQVDSNGNLLVAGSTSSANFPVASPGAGGPYQSVFGGVRDSFVAKLNADGSDLIYGTYLGGTDDDTPQGIAVDSAGNAYLAGRTRSSDFPVASPNASGAFQTTAGGGEDAFVAKLSADGSQLVYSTYLGTAAREVANDIVVDSLGAAVVAGDTRSASFPATPDATQSVYGGGSQDAFAAKLDPDGATLLFSTFVGGNDFDTAEGIALDSGGSVYVTGMTRSGNLPLASPDPAGPFQTAVLSFSFTGFVTKIQPFDDNEGPEISGVTASPAVAEVNAPASGVTLTATADDTNTGGSAIASAEYSVDGGAFAPMLAVDGAFDGVSESVTAQVGPFGTPGVYEICVRSTDAAGNIGGDEGDCVLLPVYDPNGGFVTGGGAVDSPASADLDNGADGTARFGFVSKYLPGQSTPDGNLEFRFKDGDIHFRSTSIHWLVVTGEPRAIFRGDGELNGSMRCKFEVDAWDGSFNGGDAFGLKIFACGPGGDRYALDPEPLTNGNIKIHQ